MTDNDREFAFDKNAFFREDFSCDDFIMGCKKKIALEILREDLHHYLKIIKSSMIEVINEDYSEFVSLAHSLAGLEGDMEGLELTVSSTREAVKDNVDWTSSKRQQVAALCSRLHDIRERKRLLESSRHIESCLKSLQAAAASQQLSPAELDRVAVELQSVESHLAAPHAASNTALADSLKLVRTQLLLSTGQLFVAAVHSADWPAMAALLAFHERIDAMTTVEKLFRRHVVAPQINALVHQHLQTKPDFDAVALFYNAVLMFVRQKIVPMITADAFANEQTMDILLIETVFVELCATFDSTVAFIFSPSNPTVFQQRYKDTEQFLKSFCLLFQDQNSVVYLQRHATFLAFMSRWSLSVYFQMRFQEIGVKFEKSVQDFLSGTANVTSAEQDRVEFQCEVSHCLLSCIDMCWSTEIFLSPLLHRFWKLTLQLLSRFQSMTDEFVAQIKSTALSSEHAALEHVKKELSMAMRLASDLRSLKEHLLKVFGTSVRERLQETVDSCDSLNELFRQSAARIGDKVGALRDALSEQLLSACRLHMKSVQDIPRLYRKTNREAPTQASMYLLSVVRPLSLFDELNGPLVRGVFGLQLYEAVVGGVGRDYLDTVGAVLKSVRLMEDSLRRLKKSKTASVNLRNLDAERDDTPLSDNEKIRLQLKLDLQELLARIRHLGLNDSVLTALAEFEGIQEIAA